MDIRQADIIDELLDDLNDNCNSHAVRAHTSHKKYIQINTFYNNYCCNKTPLRKTKEFADAMISHLLNEHNNHKTAAERANQARRIVRRLRDKLTVTTADIQVLNYYLCNESHISPREIDEYIATNKIPIVEDTPEAPNII